MAIDLVQKFVVQVDSWKLLEKYLRIAIGTTFPSCEEIAVKIVQRRQRNFELCLPASVMDSNQEKHFPVILISGWFLPKEGENRFYFNGYKPWRIFRPDSLAGSSEEQAINFIQLILRLKLNKWFSEFREKMGDGYNSGFIESDGSIGVGYELRNCYCSPEELAISLVHIYYGK